MLEKFPSVDVGDQVISYQKTGKGPALICLHGIAGYERTYDGILPYFNNYFTLYQLAWPGYGSKQLKGRWYRLDDMVRWVEAFREKLGMDKMYLMGNCIGANVALEYAYQHPNRLIKLLINEPHAFMPQYFYLLLYPVIGDLLFKLVFKTRIGRKMLMQTFPLEEGRQGSGYTEKRLSIVPARVMAAYLRAMYLYAREIDLCSRPRIAVPTIFPIPRDTFGQVAEFEARYGDCFENLDMLYVEGAVHNPVVENPREFSQSVLPLL